MTEERDLVPFSRELKRVMHAKNMAERDLADLLDVSPGTVNNMLAGARDEGPVEKIRRPRRSTVLKIAEGLEEPVGKWLRLTHHRVDEAQVVSEQEELVARINRGAQLLDAGELRVFAGMIEGYMIRRGYIDPPGAAAVSPGSGVHGEPGEVRARTGSPDIVDTTSLRDPSPEEQESDSVE